MAKLFESMDPCFVGRNSAVLQYTQFAYVDESTIKKDEQFGHTETGKMRGRTVMRGANCHQRQSGLARSRIKCNECETGMCNKWEAAD